MSKIYLHERFNSCNKKVEFKYNDIKIRKEMHTRPLLKENKSSKEEFDLNNIKRHHSYYFKRMTLLMEDIKIICKHAYKDYTHKPKNNSPIYEDAGIVALELSEIARQFTHACKKSDFEIQTAGLTKEEIKVLKTR